MSSVQLAPAELAGLVLESCLTGIALVMFFAAIYVLAYKRGISARVSNRPFNRLLFTVMVILLVCVVSHWIINIARAFDAFIYHAPIPGPNYIFGDLADTKNVIKTGIYIFEVVIADCILTYRLYVVWNGNKLVTILPCCTTIGALVSGTTITIVFSTLSPTTQVFANVNGRWIMSLFSFTLCTNLYATPMIAYRIWKTTRSVKGLRATPGRLSPAIQIIMESAAIYSAFTLSTFLFYIGNSNIQFPTLDSTSPIIGIVLCLITVRTELGLSYGQIGTPSNASHQISIFGNLPVRSGGNANDTQTTDYTLPETSSGDDKAVPLRSLAVHITREVDVHRSNDTTTPDQKDEGLGMESFIMDDSSSHFHEASPRLEPLP